MADCFDKKVKLKSKNYSLVVNDVREDANGSYTMLRTADRSSKKITTFETTLLVANVLLELPSAVFDQLSSVHQLKYAILSVVLSFTVLIISCIDIVVKGRKEKVKWMRKGWLPWFYSPHPNFKPFGTFADFVGLVCSIFQLIFASIAYSFLTESQDNPIRISVWPIIFAVGLLCSKVTGRSSETRRLTRTYSI